MGRTVVLVHGAWHGAWCWEQVTPHLDDANVEWRALDLPMRSLAGDAAAVTAELDAIEGPVVLVGHSYGGAVITAAGTHADVEHLVFVAALVPSDAESCASCLPEAESPATDLGDAFSVDDGGDVTLNGNVSALLYNDCSTADADAAVARLRPIALGCFTESPAAVSWRERPSTYLVCGHDLGIHPEQQRAMAARCGSDVVEWDLDHSPFYSDPARLAALLADLAGSAAAASTT